MNLIANYFRDVFALDFRSLAVFRIALGILILADLAFRMPTFTAMYTENGLVTRQLSQQFYQVDFGDAWSQYVWSLYWLSDATWLAVTLFVTNGISAMFLVLGKWTRVATIACWLLMVSLHNRNPLVITSGDYLFKMMLFWSIFLPLGTRWSLDSRHMVRQHWGISSLASMGLIFQIFAIYFFPGIAKWNALWFSGDSMSFVLQLDIYTREFGRQLLAFPGLMKLVSWGTLAAEVFFVWTLFFGWWNGLFRILNMGLFYSFHITIAFCLAIGMFPWICMVGWLALLPRCVWDRKQAVASDIDNRFHDNRFQWSRLGTGGLAIELGCAVVLALVVIWNASHIENRISTSLKVPIVEQIVYLAGLEQHFQMFGEPPGENPWFVYEGRLRAGRIVDLWTGKELTWRRPQFGLEVFPDFHWRKIHRNAVESHNEFLRQPLLDFAVRQWDQNYPKEPVSKARLVCFREQIGPNYHQGKNVSHVWGSYEDPQTSPGSLFESMMNEELDLPF